MPRPSRTSLTEARAFGADVLVVDCMLTAGYAAARRLRLPVVSLVHPLYQPFVHQWGSEVLGTDVARPARRRAAAVLALQPPGFDHPEPLPDGTTYVGAILRPGTPGSSTRATAALLTGTRRPVGAAQPEHHPAGAGARRCPVSWTRSASMPVRVLLTLGGVLAPGLGPTRPPT